MMKRICCIALREEEENKLSKMTQLFFLYVVSNLTRIAELFKENLEQHIGKRAIQMGRLFFSSSLILLPLSLFAQYEVDGIGFIDLEINDRSLVYELNLYGLPEGEIVACLMQGNQSEYFRTIIVDNQNNRKMLTRKNSSLTVVDHDIYGQSLQYYKQKNGFVQVKIRQENYWISTNDLTDIGGEIISWKSYFSNIDHHRIRVLYTMNLRTAPTVKSDKIMIVRKFQERRGLHLVEMTGKFEGNWAEVNIHIWENSDYCENRNSERTVKGWMKYLDDEGFPNIFPAGFRCC